MSKSVSTFFIILLSISLYANTIKNGFVFDDWETIVNNPMIKDLNNLPQLFQEDYFLYSGEISYRPLVTFSFFLDYALFGLNPWGYHLTNILLHAANGALLYTFLTIVIKQPITSSKLPTIIGRSSVFDYRAFVISILFAVHPILTETVNSISFREELLTFLFFVLTFVLYLKLRANPYLGAPFSFAIYLLSCLTYFFALLSKEMAITLPLIIYCYEWIYRKKGQGMGIIIFNPYNVGYMAVTLIYAYLRFYYYPGQEEDIPAFGSGIKSLILKISPEHYYYGGSLETTAYTMLRVVAYYIKLLVFPINLCGDYYQYRLSYIFDINVLLSTVFIITLLAAGLLAKKIDRLITFGMVFFFVTLLPVLNIIPIKTLIAERFLYLPSLGFILSLAAAITSVNIEYRRLIWIMVSVSIIFFSIQTYKRNLVWKDQYSFWSDVVNKMPENSRAYYNLAMSTSDLKEKIDALKMALYLNPTKDKTRSKLADAYVLEGDYQAAIKLYSDILRLSPDNTDILRSLAHAYFLKGDIYESKGILEKLVERHRNNPEFLNDLGNVYGASKEYDKSVKVLEEAIAISPRYLDAYYSLGITYRKVREFDKAIAIYNRVMEMDLSPERAYIGLGEIYLEKENYPTAIEMYKKAISFNPKNIDTYYNIAYLYATQHEFDSSLYWLKRAVDAGFRDIAFLKTDKVFSRLTGRGGFKELEHK